ncbi:hypothetical protein BX661DRAFT_184409 [Kickxella alabastrina]|uniref:uncharacterized protein n=1 Tax=Kickxella alabastrina TaxID=61397 RepID=UPI00221F0A6B|nr:uncharacterized protein BX661DRAFT_184409 [Kickxella alabastrina]KAI7825926.1 hypothetical protein BX661DRAFT_184409 [Kickxella alabastrina]
MGSDGSGTRAYRGASSAGVCTCAAVRMRRLESVRFMSIPMPPLHCGSAMASASNRASTEPTKPWSSSEPRSSSELRSSSEPPSLSNRASVVPFPWICHASHSHPGSSSSTSTGSAPCRRGSIPMHCGNRARICSVYRWMSIAGQATMRDVNPRKRLSRRCTAFRGLPSPRIMISRVMSVSRSSNRPLIVRCAIRTRRRVSSLERADGVVCVCGSSVAVTGRLSTLFSTLSSSSASTLPSSLSSVSEASA